MSADRSTRRAWLLATLTRAGVALVAALGARPLATVVVAAEHFPKLPLGDAGSASGVPSPLKGHASTPTEGDPTMAVAAPAPHPTATTADADRLLASVFPSPPPMPAVPPWLAEVNAELDAAGPSGDLALATLGEFADVMRHYVDEFDIDRDAAIEAARASLLGLRARLVAEHGADVGGRAFGLAIAIGRRLNAFVAAEEA